MHYDSSTIGKLWTRYPMEMDSNLLGEVEQGLWVGGLSRVKEIRKQFERPWLVISALRQDSALSYFAVQTIREKIETSQVTVSGKKIALKGYMCPLYDIISFFITSRGRLSIILFCSPSYSFPSFRVPVQRNRSEWRDAKPLVSCCSWSPCAAWALGRRVRTTFDATDTFVFLPLTLISLSLFSPPPLFIRQGSHFVSSTLHRTTPHSIHPPSQSRLFGLQSELCRALDTAPLGHPIK